MIIKSYIFDQDGTLYPDENTLSKMLRDKTKKWIKKELNLSDKEIEKLYDSLPKRYANPFDGFISLGLTIKGYYEEVFEKVNPFEYVERDETLIKTLNDISADKFIVTLASKNYSLKLQKALGIDTLINETLFMIDFYPETSKSVAYNNIAKRKQLNPAEICVVGNNFDVDILPAIENGFQSILVGKSKSCYSGIHVPIIYQISKTLNI